MANTDCEIVDVCDSTEAGTIEVTLEESRPQATLAGLMESSQTVDYVVGSFLSAVLLDHGELPNAILDIDNALVLPPPLLNAK